MNWEAIGAISEGIGAAGVIASLLYLAVQVRANTRASAVEAKLVSSQGQIEFFGLLVQSPEVNDLMQRGLKNLESLSHEDYYRFSNLSFMAFSGFSGVHFNFRQGTLDDSEWTECRNLIRYWIHHPGCQTWWNSIGKRLYGPAFTSFVEAELHRDDAA